MISAWESLAPTKSFFGMTLGQFKTALQPSLTARELIKDLENQLTQAQNQRDAADEVALAKIQESWPASTPIQPKAQTAR